MKPLTHRSRCERMRYIAIIAALTLGVPAFAQGATWTPAPVPSVSAGETVMPAARAGERVVNDGSTPFSSVPSGSVAAGGATSANQFNGIGTPNLSN